MDRLARKMETARTLVPPPVLDDTGHEIGIIAFGSSHWAVVEARDQLRARDVTTDYLLLKALPFAHEVARFVQRHRRVYVVEQNRDAQMAQLLRLDLGLGPDRVRSVRHYDGLPIDARHVSDEILLQEGKGTTVVHDEPPVGVVTDDTA
jgi:2-oxoglutarate ferredoxin oxidoreductase subunit alpha